MPQERLFDILKKMYVMVGSSPGDVMLRLAISPQMNVAALVLAASLVEEADPEDKALSRLIMRKAKKLCQTQPSTPRTNFACTARP